MGKHTRPHSPLWRYSIATILAIITSSADAHLYAGAQSAVVPVQYWYGPGYYYPYARPPVYVVPPTYAAPPVYAAPPAQGAPPGQFWYYCDNPKGYYPNISTCNTSWRRVPVKPTR